MKQSGFTLLETLVAMALLSLLAMGVATALRLGLSFPARAGASDHADAVWAAQSFLRRILPQALPLSDGAGAPVAFAGDGRHLEWVAALPARAAAPGLSRLGLGLEGDRLVLRWVPLAEGVAPGSHPLAEGVTALRLAYWGPPAPGLPARWLDGWAGRPALPALVRLRLDTAAGPWPDFVVALPVAALPGGTS